MTCVPRASSSVPRPDEELLFRVLGGEASAFAELLRHRRPAIVDYASRLLEGDADAADDVAREARPLPGGPGGPDLPAGPGHRVGLPMQTPATCQVPGRRNRHPFSHAGGLLWCR